MVLPNEYLRDQDWNELDSEIRTQIHCQAGRFVRQDDMEDFVQDVILTAWKNRARLDEDFGGVKRKKVEQVGAWVNGITQFKLKEYFEKSKRHGISVSGYDDNVLNAVDSCTLLPTDRLELNEMQRFLSESFATCGSKTLQAVMLQLNGCSGQEIADQLGWTRDAVYARLSRFNKKLKHMAREFSIDQLEVVYCSSISLSQVFSDAIQKRTISSCRYGIENSVANYGNLLDMTNCVETSTADQLKLARYTIEEDVELSRDDKKYVVDELNHLTMELTTPSPDQGSMMKNWKRIKIVTPRVAKIIQVVVGENTR